MRKQRVTYFTIGLILQLVIVSTIVYWFSLVHATSVEHAVDQFAANLPAFLHNTNIILIILGAITTASMMCYGAARKYSLSRSFRNLTTGLVLFDAIILLWIILTLI